MAEPASAEVAGPGSGLRVAFFSDATAGRNGTGTYYQDLLAALGGELAAMAVFQPEGPDAEADPSIPLPGDTTQRLGLPRPGRVRARLRQLRPHVVVAATPGPYGLYGARWARRLGSGLVSGYHTDFAQLSAMYWGWLGQRLVAAPMRGVQARLLRRSEAVVVMAPEFVPTVRDAGARQVEVVGTPLDPAFLEPPLAAPPTQIGRVCFVGRLAREKNLESLVQAATDWPGLDFAVAGDGPLRAELEAEAERLPNLRLLGWLDRAGVRGLIDAADLLVLPSHTETFGSIALEAMARGRPPLVAAAAGIHAWPELAEGLFRQEPSEPLSAAIGRLRALPAAELAQAAGRARELACALHRDTVAAWVDLLHRYSRGAA